MPAARLSLQIRPSFTLALDLLLVHGAAIACVAAYLPAWWARLPAATLLLASLAFHLRRSALLLSGTSITGLVLTQAQCVFVYRNAQTFSGSVEPSTFVTPLLIVINVRNAAQGARSSAVLLGDSAAARDLRALRVWLRHRTGALMPGSGAL